MKLLHVIHTLASDGGGTTTVVTGMCDALAARGHEVTVFTVDDGRPLPEDPRRLWILRLFAADFTPLAFSWQMAQELAHVSRYDLVHVHQLYRAPQALAAHYARRNGVPYCVQPHGSLDPWSFFKRERRRTKRLYERFIERRNLQGASALIYTAEGEADAAAFLDLRPPGLVVPNGLNVEEFTRPVDLGAFKERFRLANRTVILFLGLLVQRKGLDILTDAFIATARSNEKAVLVFAGPDPEGNSTELKRRFATAGLQHRVIFTGMVSGYEKYAALQVADLLVLPSYEENFGMVVVEAMASGIPVLISKNVKIWPDIVDAGAGIAVPCKADDLAVALCDLLEDSNRRKHMGKAAKHFVSRYDWSHTVQDLEAAYTQILEHGRNLPKRGG